MKLIKPKAELIVQGHDLDGICKQIEIAGRTCYKSTDKITEDSAMPFVKRMIDSEHYAMLEHGTVYLEIPVDYSSEYFNNLIKRYTENPYSVVNFDLGIAYITTNFRVIVENDWWADMDLLSNRSDFHEPRYTFRLTTSISVTRELNRHKLLCVA